MSDYIPMTRDVRVAYQWFGIDANGQRAQDSADVFGVIFDRWLRARDAQVKAEALRDKPFRFTDDQWRKYQGIPEQGYSHRAYLESVFNSWLNDRADKIEGKVGHE